MTWTLIVIALTLATAGLAVASASVSRLLDAVERLERALLWEDRW